MNRSGFESLFSALPIVTSLLLSPFALALNAPFEFKDGERVVLVGNDFIERELDQGFIETQLTTRFPDKNLIFRNLGYAGDTVFADARNLCAGWENFGPPDQGFNRLKDLIAHLKPTVIFVGYGMNESFEGERGLANFQRGLTRLLDMLAEDKPRIVIIGPTRHENLGAPFPDPSAHNLQLRLYIDALASEASRRGYPFIDLFGQLGDGTQASPPRPLTRDGIHLNPYGYWRAAQAIEKSLGYPPRDWQVELDAAGKINGVRGTEVENLKATNSEVRFDSRDELLPVALMPTEHDPSHSPQRTNRLLKVTGLSGKHELICGDEVIAEALAEEWASGVPVTFGPPFQQVERLRQLIRQKNQEFFNYWRPENDTYIFGYRHGEQGRNAVEVPRFEPLAHAKDQQIAEFRAPRSLSYVLTPLK